MLLVANRVAGSDVAQTYARADIARVNFADLFALVGVHLEQSPDALAALLADVVDGIASLELS